MGDGRWAVVRSRSCGRLSADERDHSNEPEALMPFRIPDPTSALLQVGVAFVLVFLVVLIVRYVLFLWLGYLHHIENRGGELLEVGGVEPRVTILVPVFNEAAVITAAVRSLLQLRYSAFDVLVIDDGSTDETLTLALQLAGRYGNTTVRVVSKRNGGKATALNTGLAIAESPYVLCMDGDARLSP